MSHGMKDSNKHLSDKAAASLVEGDGTIELNGQF